MAHDIDVDYFQLAASCEEEPIHTPGCIQPQGALIALDREGRVEAISENISLWFTTEGLIGSDVREIVDEGLGRLLERLLKAEGVEAQVHRARTRKGLVPVHVHRNPQDLLILEFFHPADDQAAEASMRELHRLTQDLLALPNTPEGLAEMFERVARGMQAALGYERVMVYRFLEDHSGEVIAESRSEGMEPFLRLRFPKSDIPAQARALYVRQPVRAIQDARYEPVGLQSIHGEPLELSQAVLRSVSPMHCRYLENMGVLGSMSVSVVVEGRLWGLIANHTRDPQPVPAAAMPMLGLLSRVLSAKTSAVELGNRAQAELGAAQVVQYLLGRLDTTNSLFSSLVGSKPNLRDLLECKGAVVCFRGRRWVLGTVPEVAHSMVPRLLADPSWLSEDGLLVLSTGVPELMMAGAPGVLAFAFDDDPDHYIAWFRAEVVSTVRWGGNPQKPVERGDDGALRLSPRKSFRVWGETVRNSARPWAGHEVRAAARLRSSLMDMLARIPRLREPRE